MPHYQRIHVKNLIVNPLNDRHGELPEERDAIEWLLVNKTSQMKALLNHIFLKKGVMEPPLVQKVHGKNKYVVYDGNRRISCLKLLLKIAPDNIQNPLEKLTLKLTSDLECEFNPFVECRVEDDLDLINDLLELRHIPSQNGAGQLKWDGHEKENFLERTGKSTALNFAKEVNRVLIDNGYLNKGDRIPLSTYNRLFSTKEFKRRVGVDIKENSLILINEKEKSFHALTRIAKDMIAGEKTLDDVWDKIKKTKYLDDLEQEGILPSAKDRLDDPENISEVSDLVDIKKPGKPADRQYLLSTDFPTPKQNKFFTYKFLQLFYELQNTLRFDKHGVAISIVFRSFLDILTTTYIKKNNLSSSGRLGDRMHRASVDLHSKEKISQDHVKFIEKSKDHKEYFSINTLHKVVHVDIQLSESDLRAYVNNLDSFIRNSILDINEF